MPKKLIETTVYSLSATPPGLPDRRGDERHVSLLRVGALLIGGRRELCLIRNISAGGMMIRPYSPIKAGTPLAVELKQGVTVSGVARWVDNGLTGITFDTAIDVVAMLRPPEGGPQPRIPRIEVTCTASVRHDADVHRAHTVNISQGGICVQTNGDVSIGAHVVVSVTGLAAAAGVVKWRDGDSYGIGFNRIYPVGELMSFLQDQQRGEGRRLAS